MQKRTYRRLSEPHFLLNFRETTDSKIQVLPGVSGGNLSTNPILALGDHRVAESHNVDPFLEHPPRKFTGNLGIIEHHRNDGVFAGKQIKSQLLHLLPEIPGIFMDLVPQSSGFFQKLNGTNGSRTDGGSQGCC